MKSLIPLRLIVLVAVVGGAGMVGLRLAAPGVGGKAQPKAEVASAVSSPTSQAEVQAGDPPAPVAAIGENDLGSLSIAELRSALTRGGSLAELEPIAAALAERNTAESVQALLDGISSLHDWSARAALAKNLRAVSDPDTLQALLPALLVTYGRGNTILNEISDTIGRLAQPDTVEALGALHWQASTQAGQGHKVLRTVACIRNPAAIRGLERLAARTESPALAAAAVEALRAMEVPTVVKVEQ